MDMEMIGHSDECDDRFGTKILLSVTNLNACI